MNVVVLLSENFMLHLEKHTNITSVLMQEMGNVMSQKILKI